MRDVIERIRAIDVIMLCLVLSGLIMGVFFFVNHQSRSAMLAPVAGSALLVAGWVWYRRKPRSSEIIANRLFPLALIVLSLLYGFALTPGSVPDEPYHYKVSYYYANLMSNPGDPYEVRVEDKPSIELEDDGVMFAEIGIESYSAVKEGIVPSAAQPGTTKSEVFSNFVDGFNQSASPIQIKLPSALGIALAKALGLNALWLYYLGMLFNLAFGVALVIAAVRIIPVGKNILMAISLLPMTLHLFGSYSYDVGIIGFSLLLIALLIRSILAEGPIGKGEVIAIVVVACLLAPCKVLYTLIVFLGLLIPGKRFKTKRQAILVKTIIVIAPFVAMFLFRFSTLLTLAGTEAHGRAAMSDMEEGVKTYTLQDLLEHPLHTLSMLVGSTPIANGWFYLKSLVGGSLGWFQWNIEAPGYVATALLGILAATSLPAKDDGFIFSYKTRAVFLAVFLLGALAIFISLFLDWTLNTEATIQGVQGRYFLPLLPLLLLAMRGETFTANRRLAFAMIATMCCIDITYIGYILYCI